MIGPRIWLLLTLSIPLSAQTHSSVQSVWIEKNLKWQKAPKEIQPRPESAPAAILYFYPNHHFAFFYSYVIRYGHHVPTVSAGDGFKIYRGMWTQTEGGIKVRYRLEEHTVRREGERIPGECQDGLIQFRTKELSFLGMQFEAAPGMDESVQRTALGIPNQPYEPVCNLK